jgi:hypothetical protein
MEYGGWQTTIIEMQSERFFVPLWLRALIRFL